MMSQNLSYVRTLRRRRRPQKVRGGRSARELGTAGTRIASILPGTLDRAHQRFHRELVYPSPGGERAPEKGGCARRARAASPFPQPFEIFLQASDRAGFPNPPHGT